MSQNKSEQFLIISILEWQNWSKHQFCQNCPVPNGFVCITPNSIIIQELKFFKNRSAVFVPVSLARENSRGNLKHKNRTYPDFQHFHQQHCCHHQEFQWNTWLWPHFWKVYFLQYQAKKIKQNMLYWFFQQIIMLKEIRVSQENNLAIVHLWLKKPTHFGNSQFT